jgi:predicted DNA-binding transcriptional regulator AlpA
VWADEASRLTGLAIETLYKYRQRGIGPKSGTVGRKAVWKLVDIAAWLEDRMSPEADTDRERDSRPPEPHIPRRPAASRQRVRSGV